MLREGVCQSGACPCGRRKSLRAPQSSGHDPHILQLEQMPRGLPCCWLAKGRPGAEHPRLSRELEARSNLFTLARTLLQTGLRTALHRTVRRMLIAQAQHVLRPILLYGPASRAA